MFKNLHHHRALLSSPIFPDTQILGIAYEILNILLINVIKINKINILEFLSYKVMLNMEGIQKFNSLFFFLYTLL